MTATCTILGTAAKDICAIAGKAQRDALRFRPLSDGSVRVVMVDLGHIALVDATIKLESCDGDWPDDVILYAEDFKRLGKAAGSESATLTLDGGRVRAKTGKTRLVMPLDAGADVGNPKAPDLSGKLIATVTCDSKWLRDAVAAAGDVHAHTHFDIKDGVFSVWGAHETGRRIDTDLEAPGQPDVESMYSYKLLSDALSLATGDITVEIGPGYPCRLSYPVASGTCSWLIAPMSVPGDE